MAAGGPGPKGKAHRNTRNGGKLVAVQSCGHSSIRCLSGLAALAGLLGCSGHALRVAPGSGSDAPVPVFDAIAADVSGGPAGSGGWGTATDTVTGNLEAGVVGQKDAIADTNTSTDSKIDAGLPDAGVVELEAGTYRREDASADTSPRADAPTDTGIPDAGVVDAGVPDGPADAPQVQDATSGLDVEPSLDACVPLACSNRTSCVSDYCGTIGDGCGGTLNCPTTCPEHDWVCKDGLCVGSPPTCPLTTCTTPNGNHYCGDIYDGCGGSVHCGACTKPGWICQNGLCIGPPSVCTPIPCDLLVSGVESCGIICGDGCGGTQDCGACKKSGWICSGNRCMGPLSCRSLTCNPAGGQYCGAIGDGCGGTLDCGSQCSDGSICGERVYGVCGSSTDIPVPPIPPSPPVPNWPCSPPPPAPCPPPPPPPQPR